jgi:hypothetical protein
MPRAGDVDFGNVDGYYGGPVNPTMDTAVALADRRPGRQAGMKPDRLYACALKGVKLSEAEDARVSAWASETGTEWPIRPKEPKVVRKRHRHRNPRKRRKIS